jgi:hypothetical protein
MPGGGEPTGQAEREIFPDCYKYTIRQTKGVKP